MNKSIKKVLTPNTLNALFLFISCIIFLFASSAGATTLTYTENTSSNTELALGYPVPFPINSTLPIDGFRSYSFLHARHQDMASVSDMITARNIGQSTFGQTIWAYQLSDNDLFSETLIPEPAMLQNGGIHAREWQTPEVVTGIIERFFENDDDQSFYQYLLENTNIVIIPVLNVDGFLQTQRFPDQTMLTTFFEDGASWPRDGRMRRKNMSGVDIDLNTESDNLLGIDLNRNNDPFWATSNRSSNDNRSLVHHGAGPASENETQALQAAATLGPVNRLRFYIDTHSFTQVYFTPLTGNTRRDAITASVVNRMQRVNNDRYEYRPDNPGAGIGSTDEYFAYTYQIPAYTLETEPGQNGGATYGGTGVTHSGFILPESEIRRVTNELVNSSVLGYYMQAGAPAVIQLLITEVSSGNVVFDVNWQPQNTNQREQVISTNSGLQSGIEYQARVSFNKVMRWRINDRITNYPGQNVSLNPQISIEGKSNNGQVFTIPLNTTSGHWANQNISPVDSFKHYQDDSFVFRFNIANSTANLSTAQLVQFAFQTTDLSRQSLDSDPSTIIDWVNGSWSGYESSDGSLEDNGGIDRVLRVINDNSPKFQALSSNQIPSSSSSGGSYSLFILIALIVMGLNRKQ